MASRTRRWLLREETPEDGAEQVARVGISADTELMESTDRISAEHPPPYSHVFPSLWKERTLKKPV